MQQAKAAGIDAFALNIGIDSWTGTQLGYAYDSAASNGMNVFISFDFNWYKISDTSMIGAMLKEFGSKPAQLKVGGKVFVSSFNGGGLDLDAVASAAGYARTDLFFAPNFPRNMLGSADALFNWMAWPNNGFNKAPDGINLTVSDGDQSYIDALGGKPYMAPVSPWFSTHYGPEASYSKNWVFPSDSLWFDRWTDVLTLSPQYLEIITWNDYGESHYIGPLNSPHIDDGNSKWVNDMPHDGFLSMAKPYISAFKAGAKTVNSYIESDQLIYWYRPTLKSASCDSTDTCEKPLTSPNPNYFIGKPNGYNAMQDAVFVVALLKSAGTVQVTSGGNSQSFNANAGPNIFKVNMGTGKQSFSLTRGGQTILSGDSPKPIIGDCICGIYNFNAFVGTLPAGSSDPLQADGLKNFALSMAASCQATPSLGLASAGAIGEPTATGVATGSAPAASRSAPVTSASSAPSAPAAVASSSSSPPNYVSPSNPITTAAAPVVQPLAPTTTSAAAAGGAGSKTITALSQLAPTNCMHAGYVWAGPPGSDPATHCDGG